MKKLLLVLLLVCQGPAWAASASTWPMESFKGDLQNMPSL